MPTHRRDLIKARLSASVPYLIGLMIAGGVHLYPLESLRFFLSDLTLKTASRFVTEVSTSVAVVQVQDETIALLGTEPKLEHWNQALAAIAKQQPKAIVIIKPLARWSDEGLANQSPNLDWDSQSLKTFFDLIQRYPIFQQTDRLFFSGDLTREVLAPPFDSLPTLSAPKTTDSTLFAQDGVTRRLLLTYQNQILGHYYLASLVTAPDLLPRPSQLAGSFTVYDSDQLWISFKPSGYFSSVGFHQVLGSDLNSSHFKDKIVLIGEDLGKSLKDYVKTPLSSDPSSMTLAEYHANAIETILQNQGVGYSSSGLTMGLSLILVMLVIYGSFHTRPFVGFSTLFVVIFGSVVFNFALYMATGWQIWLAQPLLSVTLSYYIVLPYRLLIEQRRTWEAQQKNKLLSQVEELKTNFISMMSHDLKTPIARIQGMVDLILKDAVILSAKQREAIDFIKSSSEDLLRVLNAILNYAKIESDGVILNKSSRDINQVLEVVINRHLFLAKVKNIQILFEPEPLFPILFDEDIIKQVFSNLIENAIKYSPDNTKVLISSEELDGMIRVQVSDQGYGIPEQDLPFLFTKFFRGSQAKSTSIKGSGLGLYLTQYFIQLHGGRVSVESEVSLGTTFTVDLPITGQG